ncbi:MAG: beta strand repeat-containing protein, partial [Pirellulales bacterium]
MGLLSGWIRRALVLDESVRRKTAACKYREALQPQLRVTRLEERRVLDATVAVDAGNLLITDPAATDNSLTITADATNSRYTIQTANPLETLTAGSGAIQQDPTTIHVPFANLSAAGSVNANLGDGDDGLALFSTNGSFGHSLTIVGGSGTDSAEFNNDLAFAANASLSVNAETITVGASADIATTGSGTIGIIADDVAIDATATISSASGVAIAQQTPGRAINIGTETAGRLSLTDAELDQITSPTLQIGDANSGAVTVTAAITHANNISLTSGAAIAINQSVTMAAGKSMSASGGSVVVNAAIDSNDGDISFSATSGAINLSTVSLDTGNGSLTLTTTGANATTISGGTKTVGGDMTVNGNLTLSGGTLDVAGTLTVTGTFTLSGGTLRNATVTSGNTILVSGGPTLDGVTLGVNTTLRDGAQVTVLNGLTLSNSAVLRLERVTGSFNDVFDTGLNFSGTQTLGGTGSVELFGGTHSSAEADLRMRPTGGGTLTIAAGVTVRNASNSLGLTTLGDAATGALILQGTVSSQATGQTLRVRGTSVTNTGTLESLAGELDVDNLTGNVNGTNITNGDLDLDGTYAFNQAVNVPAGTGSLTLRGDWDNNSGITQAGGTIHLGGTFTVADLGTFTGTAGTVSIFGTLDDAAGTLTINAARTWQVSAGTLKGVTVVGDTGAALLQVTSADGTFDAATLGVNTTLRDGAQVTVLNGLTLSNSAVLRLERVTGSFNDVFDTGLNFSGTQTLGGTGSVELFGGTHSSAEADLRMRPTGGGTLTIAAGVTVRNASNSLGLTTLGDAATGALILQGTVLAQSSGQTLRVTGSSVTNNGTLQVTSGTLDVTANLTNFSGGTLTGGTWASASGGILRVIPTVAVTALAANVTLDGSSSRFFRGSGTINVLAGLDTIAAGGSLAIGGGHALSTVGALSNAGTLTVGGTSTVTLGGLLTVEDGGTLNGTGTIFGNVANHGTVAPGNSPGIVTVNGNYNQAVDGDLDVEIGGTTPGNAATNHDQLVVNGTVTLNGNVNLFQFNSFVPTAGNTFTIIDNDDTDAVVGTFAGLAEGATISNFLGSSLGAKISYVGGDGNDVVLTAIAFTISVDLDGSGNLVVTDIDGKNNQLTASRDGSGNIVLTDINERFGAVGALASVPGVTLSNGSRTITIDASLITGDTLFINTLGGDDTLTVDFSQGNFTHAINFAGGENANDNDTLRFVGGTFNTIIKTFTGAEAGTVAFDVNGDGVGGSDLTVTYSQLEPVLINVGTVDNIVFNLPNASNQASLEDDGIAANGLSRLRSTSAVPTFEVTTFTNPTTSLRINGGNLSDEITVNPLDSLVNPAPIVLTIDGGTGTNTLTVNTQNTTTADPRFQFAGFTFDESGTPDKVEVLQGVLPGGDGVVITAGLEANPFTAPVNFPLAPTGGFNPDLTIGRLLGSDPGARAVNLPAGDNGTVIRSGIELSWLIPANRLTNEAGLDFVIYESSSNVDSPDAFMVQVRDAATGTWSRWRYETHDSREAYVGNPANGAGAFATAFDLADFVEAGSPTFATVDMIRIVSMTAGDRIDGPGAESSPGSGVFRGQGFVLPDDKGATSDTFADPGADASFLVFSTSTLDPDPLYVGSLHPVAAASTVNNDNVTVTDTQVTINGAAAQPTVNYLNFAPANTGVLNINTFDGSDHVTVQLGGAALPPTININGGNPNAGDQVTVKGDNAIADRLT